MIGYLQDQYLQKGTSRNFDFGDPRSGQFWNLTIIMQWENVQMPFFEITGENVLSILIYSSNGPLSMIHIQFWPNYIYFGSFEVIWGEIRFFFVSNFWYNKNKALGMVPICFSRKDASIDIQYDLIGLTCDLTWPWLEVKFWYWPFKVHKYMFRRVSTRGTRCCQNYVPIALLVLKGFAKKCKKRYFDFNWRL